MFDVRISMFGLTPKIEQKRRTQQKSNIEQQSSNIKHRKPNIEIKDMKELLKVLIVDDEPSILMSLEFLMKKEGYQVFIARDGSEAMDIIEKEVPSIILLDIMMPNVDGYEVCYAVKNSLRFEHIKVIFLSAKNKELDMEKGYAAGADLYVTKPFSTRALVAKVNALAINVVSENTKMD